MSILDTMPAVTDAATAEAFVAWAVREIGLGFHPDNLGVDYTNRDGVRSFTDEEARRLDEEVTATFEFIDPYEVGLREMGKLTATETPDNAS